jgi:hypothetical protein
VAALVGMYPARWKREYGDEFRDVLMRRPLDAATAFDAVWNALRQQARSGDIWIVAGLPLLAWNLAGIVHSTLYGGAYIWVIGYPLGAVNPAEIVHTILYGGGHIPDAFGIHRPTPPLGLLLPLTVGYWTVSRDPFYGRGGRAAMKNILLIYWPFFIVGPLYGLGILKVIVSGARAWVSWSYLFTLPLFQLPWCAALGWLGGLLARGQNHFWRRRV